MNLNELIARIDFEKAAIQLIHDTSAPQDEGAIALALVEDGGRVGVLRLAYSCAESEIVLAQTEEDFAESPLNQDFIKG